MVSPVHMGGRQPGLFAELKPLCGSLTSRISLLSVWFCCRSVAWPNRDGFLRLATGTAYSSLWTAYFHCWAPNQLSLSGHEGVPACGPGRAPTLTTREGWQWPQSAEPQTPTVLTQISTMFMNKCFLICYLALVDCHIPKMVVFLERKI